MNFLSLSDCSCGTNSQIKCRCCHRIGGTVSNKFSESRIACIAERRRDENNRSLVRFKTPVYLRLVTVSVCRQNCIMRSRLAHLAMIEKKIIANKIK